MIEKKILIVDDEDTIRMVLDEAFSKAGYCVRLATGAEDAIPILKNEYIPVIFIDLGLKKISGMELCEHIRKNHSSAFIYALSGNAELFSQCKKGFDDCFSKPISIHTLYKIVEDSFNKILKLTNAAPPFDNKTNNYR